MPLQNRVTPEGDIVATAARGLVMGNRGGAFHDPSKRLGRRRWANRQWICCRLEFKGRRREVMAPGRYTELFFLDEATALAAGHRPCFECRRADAHAFADAWARATGRARPPRAGEMDLALHAERLGRPETLARGALPAGAIFRLDGGFRLCMAGGVLAWSFEGYRPAADVPPGQPVVAVTPASVRAVLAAGYRPGLHPSAGAQLSAR